MDRVENVTSSTAQASHTPSAIALVVFRTVSLTVLLIVSCCGNFLVSFTLYRRQYLLTPSNKFVYGLTFSNFVFSIFILPFMIMSSIQQMWMSGTVWCSLSGFFTLTIISASMFTLAMISYDRYYAVVHPLKYVSHVTSCRVLCIILCCWLTAALFSLPPLFGLWSNYQYSNAQMGCFWNRSGRSFGMVWSVVCLILPFCIMVASYTCIFRVAWTKTKRICGINPNQYSSTKSNTFFCEENEISCRNESKTLEMDASRCPSLQAVSNITKKENHSDFFVESPNCSPVVDSGLGTSSHDDAENFTGNLPNQIADECSRPSKILFLNKNVTSPESFNNNNASGIESANAINNGPTASNNMISNQVTSSRNTDVQYLTLPLRPERKSCQNHGGDPNSEWKKTSFHEAVAVQQPPLNNSARSINQSPFAKLRNLSRSSNISRSSALSLASNRSKFVSYSLADYYNNQKKAMCTILSVVGILSFCTFPFIVTSLYDATHGEGRNLPEDRSEIADWMLSIVTILLLCTCVYHPLVYGLWNRSVRQEMRNIICGGRRGPATRRTRILSLTSHLKDLSLSPRITAAIMLEGAAMATIVRPMKLNGRSLSRHSTRICEDVVSPAKKSMDELQKKHGINPNSEKEAGPSSLSVNVDENLDAKNKVTQVTTNDDNLQKQNTLKSSLTNNKQRDREQPASSLLQINSADLLSSDLLLPTLLYTSPSFRLGNLSSSSKNTHSLSTHLISCNPSAESSQSTDSMAKLTSGKVWSSNLVHLEAGEPIKVRKWDKEQTIDFFAQTFAYDLVESANDFD